MRRIVWALFALLVLPACDDDTTGPGPGVAPEWVEVELPAEFDEDGHVVALASGGGRVVGLVRAVAGEYVIEPDGDAWNIVFGVPLPRPPVVAPAHRNVPFGRAQDIAVDETGAIYVVGRMAPSDPLATSSSAVVWTESTEGWATHEFVDLPGALTRCTAVNGGGILAYGEGADRHLICVEGSPQSGFETSDSPPLFAGYTTEIYGVARVGGTDYVAASVDLYPGGGSGPQPLFLSGRRADLEPMDVPCDECGEMFLTEVIGYSEGVIWSGSHRPPTAPPFEGGADGWLTYLDPARDEWMPVELPDEIMVVSQVVPAESSTLFFTAELKNGDYSLYWGRFQPGAFGGTANPFSAEAFPPASRVYCLTSNPQGSVIAGGSDRTSYTPLVLRREP